MAKAFTESNKNNIRNVLLQKGREYFIRYGLKKTSIDELTRAAGIAKGTFYRFFESKEALFMAIHEESENSLQQDMTHKLENLKNPEDILRTFFQSAFQYIEDDPLMRSVFTGGDISDLSAFMSTENYQEHYRHDISFLESVVINWQQQGIVRPVDASVASVMIASAYYIILQKDSLTIEMYNRVIEMLIDSLVNYLKAE